jgi:flagellar protein FlgJ
MSLQITSYVLQEPSSTETSKASKNVTDSENKKLKQACKDFESIFLGYMLKSMRKTVEKNELMGNRQEEELFQDMMDDEICKSAADTNSIGIADTLYKQLNYEISRQSRRGDNR